MKKACYQELIKKYETPIENACDMEEGMVFLAGGWKKPDGFCDSAWDSISPFVMALSHGAEDLYDGWMKNKKTAMISCNDGFRPKKKTAVAFAIALELERPEMSDLLSRAEIAFSPSSKFDLIITYFVMHHIYDILRSMQPCSSTASRSLGLKAKIRRRQKMLHTRCDHSQITGIFIGQ